MALQVQNPVVSVSNKNQLPPKFYLFYADCFYPKIEPALHQDPRSIVLPCDDKQIHHMLSTIIYHAVSILIKVLMNINSSGG